MSVGKETDELHRSLLDRVLRALDHPVRRDILAQLLEAPQSAKSLSDRSQHDLNYISYHLNDILAKDCSVLELADTVQKRGAFEKWWRLDLPTLASESGVDAATEISARALEAALALAALGTLGGATPERIENLVTGLTPSFWFELEEIQDALSRVVDRHLGDGKANLDLATEKAIVASLVGARSLELLA